MARTENPAPVSKAVATDTAAIGQTVGAANTLAVIELSKQEYTQDRDLLNQLLGQAQMADAIGKLTATVAVSKIAFVKETKLYQQLSGMKDRDGRGLQGTWEEFCKLLGTSAPKANEDISNLQTFGEAALESMSAMGIGYREMRQYRRLSDDQKQALIEVAKAGDKESFVELAEEIIGKHAKEKDALQKDLAAKDQRIARHTAKIQEYEDKADRWAAMPVHAQVAESAARALGLVQGELRQGFVALAEHQGAQGGDADGRVVMAGYLGQLQQQLNALREEFALTDVVGDGTPAYQRWAAEQDAGKSA